MSGETISLDQMIACAKRESALRQRVYPKWVAGGRMKQSEADKEIATMNMIVQTLTAMKVAEAAA